MLAGELEAFPLGWLGWVPDLMGQRRKDEPPPPPLRDKAAREMSPEVQAAYDEWGNWYLAKSLDDRRVMMCGAAAYWAQRARDLKAEELATAAVATVASGHPGAWERATTAQLVGWGVEGWLRRLAGARDPERLHWALADRALADRARVSEAEAARVRGRFGIALCDALRELAAAVLPAFLVADLDVEDTAAGAAAAALAWLEPWALQGDADDVRRHSSGRREAYRAAVGGPIVLADRVPLMVAGRWAPPPDDADRVPLMVAAGPEAVPDGGWWVAPAGSNLHSRAVWSEADRVAPVQPGEPALDDRWGAPGGAELWLQWLPKCSEGLDSLIVRIVADATLARVRAALQAEATAVAAAAELRLRSRPAVPVATMGAALMPAFTGARLQGELPGVEDRTLRDAAGRALGVVAAGEDVSKVLRGLGKWHTSIIPHRVVRELLVRSHTADAAGERDARRVVFAGWRGLADAIGAPRKGDMTTLLEDVLTAGAGVRWALPGLEGAGLWTFSTTRPAPGRDAALAVILGDALMPGYAAALKRLGGAADTPQRRELRRLVPELLQEPPMDGLRERDHGRAYTLARMVVLGFTRASDIAAERGAVPITDAQWAEWAALADLSVDAAKRLREGPWLQGGAKLPALLRREGDGWALSLHHDPQWAFIVEGGLARLQAQRAGKRGGRRRGHR